MQLVEHLTALEITHDAMLGAISTSWMDLVTLSNSGSSGISTRSRALARRKRFSIGKSESESGGKLSGTFPPLRFSFNFFPSLLSP